MFLMKASRTSHGLVLLGSILVILTSLTACQSASSTTTPTVSVTRSPLSPTSTPEEADISGVVVGGPGGAPLSGATVRIRTTTTQTTTDGSGRFRLGGLKAGQPVSVSAWVSGYFINGVAGVLPGTKDEQIVLSPIGNLDNLDYVWMPSTYHAGAGENQGCAQCHSAAGTSLAYDLPVDEWLQDAHAQSATNPRFLSMYAGTDLSGHQSPSTEVAFSRDYGRFPLPPDLTKPYYGPGYKLDFPDTSGNCAACHAPEATVNSAYAIDPTRLSGLATEGIACDFCHKVWDVKLDAATGLPVANQPGVLSLEFRRPSGDSQFFAGPFDDVFPGHDTYTPVQQESRFCAPCHFGAFWGIQVYNSYGEWLQSPYSVAGTGKTCQDCHMPHSGETYFARPDQGGVARDPASLFGHRMPGAADETLLRNAVRMTVSAHQEGLQVRVEVTLLNDRTGHSVPTDSPLRQMLLLVRATDAQGRTLSQMDGPILPDWAGQGDPAKGYYAGLPGKAFARVLAELWTDVTPTGAYWNQTRVVGDNRLSAFGSDTSNYTFAAPGGGIIKVSLIYRRAFIQLIDWKDWAVPDIMMDEQTIQLQ
jgi:hypothetical protein